MTNAQKWAAVVRHLEVLANAVNYVQGYGTPDMPCEELAIANAVPLEACMAGLNSAFNAWTVDAVDEAASNVLQASATAKLRPANG